MKKLFIIFLFPLSVFAQDTLITTKGDIYSGKVTLITPYEITYENTDGIFTIPIEMVFDKKINGHPTILTPLLYNAEKAKEINLAGSELQRASSTFYGGAVLMIIGGVMAITGATLNKTENPNLSKAIMYAGIGISGVGVIINFSAFGKINSAGRHLSRYKP